MDSGWRSTVLRWLRVPPRPEPPAGAPGSERVFRSGRNALRLSLAAWGVNQVFALMGLIFGLSMLQGWKSFRSAAVPPEPLRTPAQVQSPDASSPTNAPARRSRRKKSPWEVAGELSRKTPDGVLWLLTVVEGFSLITFLVQIPVTYALRRLEYEQRWFLVTDRSLRLRSGVWQVREVTMSFANLQQITVSQGPLQRLLGLADVRVQSAGGGGGGGGSGHGHSQASDDAHLGYFRAVDNAEEIRDLITERLRRFRESGLGDPEEAHLTAASCGTPAGASSAETRAAARELLGEVRVLRQSLAGG
ncbi:MAG: PH domain-containing protein [Verrucomicrobia bacterium]|nr:PH domain-containing protein [Verrucomicrobiota bacterium]